jgi:general secretion pathway protein L
MSKKYFGIDIESNAVSLVVLEAGIKTSTITTALRIPLTDPEDRTSAVTEALRQMIGDTGGGVSCAVSIPPQWVSYRNIQVPFKNRKKISQILPFELEPTLPFPIDELALDFSIIKSAAAGELTDLITATTEKSKIEDTLDILGAVTIQPEMVLPGGYATALCLIQGDEMAGDWLFLDVGDKNGTVILGQDNAIGFMRTFRISNAQSGRLSSITTNIRQSIGAYEASLNLNFEPGVMWISGVGIENGNEMAAGLTESFKIPVHPLDLAAVDLFSISAESNVEWQPLAINNALALALAARQDLGGMNFHRRAGFRENIFTEYKSNILATGALLLLVLAMVGFNFFQESRSLSKQVDHLDQQMAAVYRASFPDADIVDPLKQMQQKVAELKQAAGLSGGKTGNQIRVIDLLGAISKQIPDSIDVEVTRLVIGSEQILMDGETANFESVDKMKNNLEQIEYFNNITITSANLKKDGSTVRFKFKIPYG